MTFSERTYFRLVYISNLFLRNIKEVKYTVVTHDSEPIVLLVKCHCLKSFINFYFRKAQIAVEIPAYYLHEAKSRLFVFSFCISICVSLAKSVLLELDAFLNRRFYFEQVNRRFIRGACYDMQRWVEHYPRNRGVSGSSSQCLQSLTTVCAEDLDYCTFLGS